MEEGSDWLVGVVQLFHGSIVVLDIGGSEAAVGSVEMDQHLSCGDIGESCDAMVEGAQVEFVDGADDLLLEGFVGGLVLDEERVLFVVVLAYIGNLGARESVWDGGGRARIERNGEGLACECIMYFRGDGEGEQA
jgi:hypothetical protein